MTQVVPDLVGGAMHLGFKDEVVLGFSGWCHIFSNFVKWLAIENNNE